MEKKTFIFLFISILIFSSLFSDGDNLEETLGDLAEDAAISYVDPVVSAFGSNLNGGWFHRVPEAKKIGFNLEVGVVGMATFFTEANKSFSTTGKIKLNEEDAETMTEFIEDEILRQLVIDAVIEEEFTAYIYGPTIVGSQDDSIKIDVPETLIVVVDPLGEEHSYTLVYNKTLEVGGLLNEAPILPLAVPQISIGTLYGTKMVCRFFSMSEVSEELGDLQYFGIGFQHNPEIWLPYSIPVKIALSFYTQSLKIGSVVKTRATAYGINVGRTHGFKMLNITPYAGLMFESSKMEFAYDYIITVEDPDSEIYEEVPTSVKFDLEGENKFRVILGISFRLGVVDLNFDYNFGKYNSVAAGLGLTF